VTDADDLRGRIEEYLKRHHTMTLATTGASPAAGVGSFPHAASVFYAVDDHLRLVFLSKKTSLHSLHVGTSADVAVTVSEDYNEWSEIKGVQMWGRAGRLGGAGKLAAMALYLARFPFVHDFFNQRSTAELMREIGVYRFTPDRAAFTDNSTGVFGREILALAE
jgi:uncharacterized protein YhbP (UPF0306 family)